MSRQSHPGPLELTAGHSQTDESEAQPTPAPSLVARSLRFLFVASCWFYLLILIGLWALLHYAADVWWVATIIAYGPRWITIVPLSVLVPFSVMASPRSLLVLILCGGVAVGPILGLCVPLGASSGSPSAQPAFRLATFNVHHLRTLPKEIWTGFMETSHPDIVVFQAWSSRYLPAVIQGGWHTHRNGELFVLSRFPIRSAEQFAHPDLSEIASAARYVIETPGGMVQLVNVHLTSPREGLESVVHGLWRGAPVLEANSSVRWRESKAVSEWALRAEYPLVLAGDFNLPAQSLVYRSYWSGFTDAFSVAGFGFGNTFFTRRSGVRIDHILVGEGWRVGGASVGPHLGSAHRPVVADVSWSGVNP